MRILHINEHLSLRGGVETYLLSLLPHLQSQGHETAVAYAAGDASLAKESHYLPLLADGSRNGEQAGRASINQILVQGHFDLVHLHNIYNVGAIQACLETVPTVLTAHDYRYICPASTFFHRRTLSVCERVCGPACFVKAVTHRCLTPRPTIAMRYYHRVRWMAHNAERLARVIAPSQYCLGRFAQAGFTEARLSMLPYFCPLEPLTRPRPTPDPPTITYIGRLSDNKGYQYFIQALGLLPSSVSGRLVGNLSPEREARLQRLAFQAGCADRLQLHPWAGRDEIRTILDGTSILIFPSIWPETLGIAGLEALATGVPVVASDLGGVREWLHPGETGLLVPPKDASAIADAVQQLLRNSSLAYQMGEQGLSLIRNTFSPEGHLSQLTSIYQEAVSPPDRRVNIQNPA